MFVHFLKLAEHVRLFDSTSELKADVHRISPDSQTPISLIHSFNCTKQMPKELLVSNQIDIKLGTQMIKASHRIIRGHAIA
jgi:hypothetical protein